jgi:hypothetical protein
MLQSGLPLNVTLASDVAGAGRPNVISDPRAGVSGTQFLNPAAFAVPAAEQLGCLAAEGFPDQRANQDGFPGGVLRLPQPSVVFHCLDRQLLQRQPTRERSSSRCG